MSGAVGDILSAWRELAKHASACARCRLGVERLVRVPEEPRRVDGLVHGILCADGGDLFAMWWDGKTAWLAGTEDHRRRQFLTSGQLFDDGVTFAVRARAIMSMPPPEFSAWLALDNEPRRNQLRALEAVVLAGAEKTEQHPGDAAEQPPERGPGATTRRGWHRPGGSRRSAVLEPAE